MRIIDTKSKVRIRVTTPVLRSIDDRKTVQNSILQEKGNISKIEQSIPELQKVELTQKQFKDTITTYNESTVSYSDSSQVYGGIYGTDGELPITARVFSSDSITSKVVVKKPSVIKIADIENSLRKIIDL